MSRSIPQNKETIPFISFVTKDKENKKLLLIILGSLLIEFIIFKILYPYPSFFSDSYSYIFAANARLDVNVWPIGYSKFLQFFPWFTHSHTALITFQFYFLEIAALYFFFTLLYFYRMQKIVIKLLVVFLFLNPLLLYVSNYVTSDALFIGLSLLWVTQLVWIINRPHLSQIPIQGILLFLAFTVRYNAMYYPIIAAFAFLISTHRPLLKTFGILVGPLLILPFILHSRNAAKELTGTAQFPLLGGWQWGNNALYIRDFIDVDSSELKSKETAELDELAKQFFLTVPQDQRDLPNYVANYFIRKANAPLRNYMHLHYVATDEFSNLVGWGKVSPIYGRYGKSLIGHHPLAFAQHFLLVNTKNYFIPPLEQLKIYNLGQDTIWHRGQNWFYMPTTKIRVASKYLQEPVLLIFPPLFLLLNLFYLAVLCAILALSTGKMKQGLARSLVLITSFLILNFCFSVFANIIVIRYQIFPMILLLSFGLVLLEHLLSVRKEGKLSEAGIQIDNRNYKMS